jgi:molecular chaperone GrpE
MAVFQEEREDIEDHTVLEIFEKGYSLRGKVLRPAKVKVSHKIEIDSPESTEPGSTSGNSESETNE